MSFTKEIEIVMESVMFYDVLLYIVLPYFGSFVLKALLFKLFDYLKKKYDNKYDDKLEDYLVYIYRILYYVIPLLFILITFMVAGYNIGAVKGVLFGILSMFIFGPFGVLLFFCMYLFVFNVVLLLSFFLMIIDKLPFITIDTDKFVGYFIDDKVVDIGFIPLSMIGNLNLPVLGLIIICRMIIG